MAYVDRTMESTAARKANICCVFLFESTIRMAIYGLTGMLTLEVLRSALLLAPGMLVGLVVGVRVSKKSPDALVRNVTILLLVIMGGSVFLTNL